MSAAKQLSIRLAAVGGDKVRQEFKSLGNDGQRAFARITQVISPANDNLRKLNDTAKVFGSTLRQVSALAGVFLGFKGTDTHGVKLLRREKIIEIVQECQTDQEVFDTELILRAQKRGLKIKELPVIVREKRITRYSLIKRVPRTLKDLWILRKNLYHAV